MWHIEGGFLDYAYYDATSMERKFGKPGNALAVVIPVYNEYGALARHLSILKGQGFRRFDVFLVLSDIADFEKAWLMAKKSGLCGIVLKRESDTGSAGGFYLGASRALASGCKAVVFADVDALPCSSDVIALLWKKFESGADFAMSESRLSLDGKAVASERVLNQYSLVSARLAQKAGLHYAPAYLGADDAEYAQRLSRLCRPQPSGGQVSHPLMDFGSRGLSRSVAYSINLALLWIPEGWHYYLYFFGLAVPAFIFFGNGPSRKAGVHAMACLLGHRLGKGAYSGAARGETEGGAAGFDRLVSASKAGLPGAQLLRYSYEGGIAGKAKNGLALSAGMFGKAVALKRVNMTTVAIAMALGRKAAIIGEDGRAEIVSDNGGALRHAAKAAAFAACLPLFVLAAAASLPVSIALRPNTAGYGIRKGRDG